MAWFFQMQRGKDTLTATFTLIAQTFLRKIQFASVTSRNENFTVEHGNAKPRDVHWDGKSPGQGTVHIVQVSQLTLL